MFDIEQISKRLWIVVYYENPSPSAMCQIAYIAETFTEAFTWAFCNQMILDDDDKEINYHPVE